MADMTHKFQAPKGTRDFYPAEMAVRRYIESVWREVSINHGFEEIDGPTFEHLELYTRKSGEEIVSQLFSFRRADGDTDYALRPEFTPTLARMYSARAGQLPKPTKWFCIPSFFRAERPQRGRLREFFQWNIDVLGDDSPRADAEVIACVIDVLKRFGLAASNVRVALGSRPVIIGILLAIGVDEQHHSMALELLDRRDRIESNKAERIAKSIGFSFAEFDDYVSTVSSVAFESDARNSPIWRKLQTQMRGALDVNSILLTGWSLLERGLGDWVSLDLSIVRGLAYYTGTVFEVHETTGKERAIAGGGRYDGLVELFGGPSTPAVGVAMGDVVLRLMLEDRGLLPSETEIAQHFGTQPDVFVISANEDTDSHATKLISELRTAGLHVRQSYKSTRNVGKLLGDANKCSARFAVIVGDELQNGNVQLKNLETQDQDTVALNDVAQLVRSAKR